MIKVMHIDTVFEVFIFKFFYFGYFFYARRGTYLMMVNFLKTLKPPISGESSTKMSYLGPPHTNTRSYGIKRWNTMRKKKYLWYHLYHCDHDDRLILASYVVPQINEYLILRNIYFFAPKSLLVCIPTTGTTWYYYRYYYLFNNFRTCTTL